MSKSAKLLFFSCFFVFFAWSLSAEVFSLWPLSGSGGGNLENVLDGNLISTEPVIVNGVTLSLSTSLLEIEMQDCLARLRKLYPKGRFAANEDSALLTITDSDGTRKRIYLVHIGGKYPVIQFSMTVPASLPKNFIWPSQLPIPSDGKPLTYMSFPERNALYGAFTTNLASHVALADLSSSLRARGWEPVSKEWEKDPFNASGEVYLKQNPKSIMFVSVGKSELPDDSFMGTVYTRPLGK